jgi:flagellar motility protein MotE (MotC chaperone)
MKALTSPVVVILLAVICSAGPMLGLLWKESAALVQAAAGQRAAAVEATRPEKPWDFWTPEVENLARELTEQREKFAARELELAAREKRLAEEARQLEEIRQQVAQLRSEIDARVVEVKEQEMRNLKSLAGTYSRLTPPAAVAIFSQLDDLMVAKLLSLMKPEITSAIFEELSRVPGPDNVNVKRAAELSQRLRLLLPAPKTES